MLEPIQILLNLLSRLCYVNSKYLPHEANLFSTLLHMFCMGHSSQLLIDTSSSRFKSKYNLYWVAHTNVGNTETSLGKPRGMTKSKKISELFG